MNTNAKDVAQLEELIGQTDGTYHAKQTLYLTGLNNGITKLVGYFKRGCQLADEYVQRIRDAYQDNTLRLRV